MKRLIIVLVCIVVSNFVFAQTAEEQAVSVKFLASFNAKEYDQLFNSFSPEMKQSLPIEKTRAFFTNLRNQLGSIEGMEFSAKHDTYALYKTKFEKAIMGVNISLDGQNQINGFFIKPFQQLDDRKKETVNLLVGYPKEIGELIFAAGKDLPNGTQLSIAIIKNGNTNYYGIKKMNDTIKPAANQNKVFEIGSITKVFTSTLLASLVVDKKINLTDEINQLFPFEFKDNIRLNLITLANHTSGLPRLPENLQAFNTNNPYKNYGKVELENYLKNLMKRDHEPGKTYSYSNLGAGLLGYSLGLSQKTTFQQLLQKRVFDKYKMTNSFISSKNLGNELIKGLDKSGAEVANWDFDVLFGAGGILSTSQDLVKFANAQFNLKNKELEFTRRTTFDIKDDTKIGLGWHIVCSATTENVFWHNGGTGGYSSSIVMKVKEKSAVIVLSNVFDINNKIDPLSYSLLSLTNKK